MDFNFTGNFSANAFVIRKTLQRNAIRTEGLSQVGLMQTKQRNMTLFLNKKFAIMAAQQEGLNKTDIMKQIMGQMERHTKDPVEMETIRKEVDEEMKQKAKAKSVEPQRPYKKPKKQAKFTNQSQVLRAFINERIQGENLEQCYKSYKVEQLKAIFGDLKPNDLQNEAKKHEVINKISEVTDKGNRIEKVDEYYVSQALERDRLNLNEMFQITEEVKKQPIPRKAREELIFEEIIRKHRDRKVKKILLHDNEQREAIRLFKMVDSQAIRGAHMSALEIHKLKESQEQITRDDTLQDDILLGTRRHPSEAQIDRFTRDTKKFKEKYEGDGNHYLTIAAKQLRQIRSSVATEKQRTASNPNLSATNLSQVLTGINNSQILGSATDGFSRPQASLNNSQEFIRTTPALRPNNSLLSTGSIRPSALGRSSSVGRHLQRDAHELMKSHTEFKSRKSSPTATHCKIENDHLLELIDKQKFKEELHKNFEKTLAARTSSLKKRENLASQTFTYGFVAESSTRFYPPNSRYGSTRQSFLGKTVDDEVTLVQDPEVEALKNGAKQLCQTCDSFAAKTKKQSRSISRKIRKLERKTKADFKKIDNPYLRKDEMRPKEFVDTVNRSYFKKILVDKMLVQITNKSDMLKELKQQKTKASLFGKIAQIFTKKSQGDNIDHPAQKTNLSNRNSVGNYDALRNALGKDVMDILEQHLSEQEKNDEEIELGLDVNGPPVEAWARALNLYRIINRVSIETAAKGSRANRLAAFRATEEITEEENSSFMDAADAN